MAHLLYIESSPRKDRSASIEVSQTFLDEYRKIHPDDTVETLDLWDLSLPEFNGEVINAKYAILLTKKQTEEQVRAWRAVEERIAHFTRADKYLFSLPMWNFGIPYRLKHFFDIIIQPGYTFTYSPSDGYQGLAGKKPVLLISARGGAYGQETGALGMDFQMPYMHLILRFIGFTDIRSIIVEPMLMAEMQEKTRIIAAAKERARQFARDF